MKKTKKPRRASAAEHPPTRLDASKDPRWAAVLARDPAADGQFVYAVKTTGVYCRASSSSRIPKPENVEFFASAAAAEAAGYRASKRAASDRTTVARHRSSLVAEACRRLEEAEELPTLEAVAADAGMSAYHFHRVFKEVTGLTPKAYAAAFRARRVREQLTKAARSITSVIYDSGFGSNGRFYEVSNRLLGMKPKEYRAGGMNTEIHFAVGHCSYGDIVVAKSTRGVCAILLGDDPEQLVRDLQDQFPNAELIGDDPGFEDLVARVVAFVEAPSIGLDLPLDIRGTAFQERVWRALLAIRPGDTASYADIAKRIGQPKAVRAVAQACARNHLAVAIPCHRVVRNDGNLSGYRWGVERKRELLDRERRVKDATDRKRT